MTEAIDAHVLKKYEIQQKLGKGVRRGEAHEVMVMAPWELCHACPVETAGRGRHKPTPNLQAYGIVWRAVDKRTGDVVALKKIFDAFQNATDAQVPGRGRIGVPCCSSFLRPTSTVRSFSSRSVASPLQRTFREIMFLQELSNHENIIRFVCC